MSAGPVPIPWRPSGRPRPAFVRAAAGLCAAALAASPAVASAQSAKDLAAARQAFKDGEDAEGKGDLTVAVTKYRQALAVKATPQLYLRIGAVEEKLGRLVDALASYTKGLEKASSLPAVAKIAKEQVEALRLRVPLVTLSVPKAPPDLVVTLDGAPVALGSLGAELPVDPGVHRVHAQAPGFLSRDQAFTAAERGRTKLVLELLPSSPAAPPPPPPPPSKLPGILVTAGGAAFVVGGVALLAASYAKDSAIDAQCHGSARDKCPLSQQGQITSEVHTANALRFSGIGMGVVGAAGAATGIYLLVRKPAPTTTGSVQVVPAMAPGAAQVLVSGRF